MVSYCYYDGLAGLAGLKTTRNSSADDESCKTGRRVTSSGSTGSHTFDTLAES